MNGGPYPPKMDRLLDNPLSLALIGLFGRREVKRALAESLEEAKEKWRRSGGLPSDEEIITFAGTSLESALKPPLSRVVNGTGVVIHTNLGRAPISKDIFIKASELLSCYVDIEWNRETGERGFRDRKVEALFKRLLGTDMDVVVVNNCAAALLLVLNALALGKEVIVSRGELVEIGGRFRIPEILSASGAMLKEVGSTNKTSCADYRENICENTGLILKVNHSNFEMVGFTGEAALEELLGLGRERGIPVIYDFGSGLILDEHSMAGEPSLEKILKMAPDMVCFSGDKLMGGCQAGFILARKEFSGMLRKAPILRALRVDKTVYHILGEILLNYLSERYDQIPALRILNENEPALKKRAQRLRKNIEKSSPGRFDMQIVSSSGKVGGGSAPLHDLPSPSLRIVPFGSTPEKLEDHLRCGGVPPVLAVVQEGSVFIHMRTLLGNDHEVIVERLNGFREGKE